ncbi:ABC transporter ATP-binding protein [Clostridium transplantifaecale]|uniref:ABC transporter ATP-binding protein n=1 Tax=Clostridium transplantifaecale TaxID=2479838 RepID=UPI000F642A9E|nr:oligopeptide/dipeptide ABC transporter ATP-binding protein [Clostridium transplantifaecale]
MAEQNREKDNREIETGKEAEKEVILEVKDVKKWFPGAVKSKEFIKAVDGVSLSIKKGETFGLVGESGCGKSTLARLILSLYKATAGDVYFHGKPIYKMNARQLREVRREMQVIFQDPYEALDPYLTIEEIIMEPLDIHQYGTKQEKREKVEEMCNLVGLPVNLLTRMPHQLSGGQRQRVNIARSLALNPEFVICDEAVSALDVSVQAQILNLLRHLQKELGLTYLFISHNLSVVKYISDTIGVMYFGHLVEVAPKNELFAAVKHPYTHALLSAVPLPDPDYQVNTGALTGDVPSLLNPPSGCIFHERCPYKQERCEREAPVLERVSDCHQVACHRYKELTLKLDYSSGFGKGGEGR